MGESRTELIAWLNDLLGLGYTKVEQCGTGAAYAQIIDSIYGNVPMAKINWQAKHEYEYLTNYKVLQEVFKRNKIAKPIPVDRLTKCKMQDNLEWLQWSKKYWDANYPGGEYDAEERRHGATVGGSGHGAAGAGRLSAGRPSGGAGASAARARSPAGTGMRRPGAGAAAARGGGADSAALRSAQQQHEQDLATLASLNTEVEEMRTSVSTIERERDFYFDKLREIEIIVTERLNLVSGDGAEAGTANAAEVDLLSQVQSIMYATDEGFTAPEDQAVDEQEMF